jgi:hypothetical protein
MYRARKIPVQQENYSYWKSKIRRRKKKVTILSEVMKQSSTEINNSLEVYVHIMSQHKKKTSDITP